MINKINMQPKERLTGRMTEVYVVKPLSLMLGLALALISIGVGILCYIYDFMWMFFCILLTCWIQGFAIVLTAILSYSEKQIDAVLLPYYAEKERKFRYRCAGVLGLIGLLDLYPFLFWLNYHTNILGENCYMFFYEGGVLVSLISLAMACACFGLAYHLFTGDYPMEEYLRLWETERKTHEDMEEEKKEAERQRLLAEHRELEKIYGLDYMKVCDDVYINENNRKMFFGQEAVDFKDIIAFSVRDDNRVIYSGTTTVSRPDNTSIIGRAMIGGAFLGKTGAIIGGATGARINYNSGSESYIKHDYTVVITVNDLTSSVRCVHVGDRQWELDDLVSILNVILHQNTCKNNNDNVDGDFILPDPE